MNQEMRKETFFSESALNMEYRTQDKEVLVPPSYVYCRTYYLLVLLKSLAIIIGRKSELLR